MAVFVRAKRVSDPLDDKVKARLRGDDSHRMMTGCASSGSDHDAACLSGLVHAFLEIDDPSAAPTDAGSSGDSDGGGLDCAADAAETVRDLLDPLRKSDPFRVRLQSDVMEAAEALSELRLSGSGYRRAVMARLRETGYNAGICKSKWGNSSGLTAGSYEYIDVAESERYIVDLEFSAEFEVARATAEYGRLAAAIPRVAVAREEEVREVVRIAAKAVRRSLQKRDLHVPPWRKKRYMLAKWLGPYKRTVNPLPASAGAAVSVGGQIKCRYVGFASAAAAAGIGGGTAFPFFSLNCKLD